MAHYVKESYPPLIGGETQQLEQDSHPNQVQTMLNMLPDAVSGIRRRGGFQFLRDMQFSTLPYMQHVTIKEREYLLFIEAGAVGRLQLYDIETEVVVYETDSEYLRGETGPQDIDYVVHSDELFLLNRTKIVGAPIYDNGGKDPKKNGFFTVVAGRFDTAFTVGLRIGDTTTYVTHKTPDTGAANAQPEKIATALANAANSNATIGSAAGFTWTAIGGYLHVVGTKDFVALTKNGPNEIRPSNESNVRSVAELAAKLPSTADGIVVRTGTKLASAYWQWDNSKQEWNETCAYGQDVRFTNLPLRLRTENGVWELVPIEQSGRMAGDFKNNPDPSFADRAITGLGSFQGRLVLLSGDSISLSGTDEVGQWFRTTMTNLTDTDSIDAKGTTSTGVQYRYALPLDGDLILFSATQQSTITGRTVVTNKTISLAPSGMLPMLPYIKPVPTGRGLLLASPTAPGYCSIWEIRGGQFRDGAYAQHDTTLHLPTYIKDDMYTLTAGLTGKYAVAVGGDCSIRVMSTIQHLGEVIQQSWHTWNYIADSQPVTIAQAQLHNEILYLLVRTGGAYRLLRWSDSFVGGTDFEVQKHLDEVRGCTYTDSSIEFPYPVYNLMTNGTFLSLYKDPMTGAEVWNSYNAEDFEWEYVDGKYVAATDVFKDCTEVWYGWRYVSALEPKAPMVMIGRSKSAGDNPQMHRLMLRCRDTGTVQLSVFDRARDIDQANVVPAMLTADFNSTYLRARNGVMQFPMRTDMHSTRFTLQTSDVYDMRIEGIEYGYRPRMRYARAPAGG